MILPAQEIRRLCASDARFPMITPFFERTYTDAGLSFGLSPAGYDVRIDQRLVLRPGDFVLASTMEKFIIPSDVLVIVHDKSTWARRGVCVQNTVIDPGWRGYLTLEITNHSHSYINTNPGEPIAQLVFHKLMAPTSQPYQGQYQDQEAGPTPARD